jgi:hypothetical protein
MESALGEGGTRLMCSVGKDVMGMDQFGNPDGRLVVNADVPIADHGTWSASATSVFSPTAGVAVHSHAAVLFSVHTTAQLIPRSLLRCAVLFALVRCSFSNG